MKRSIVAEARVGSKGRLTLPDNVRDALQIGAGDNVLFQRTEDGVLLSAAVLVPKDQAWFYHPAMQARIVDAEEDIAERRVREIVAVDGLKDLGKPIATFRRARGARRKRG